MNVPAIGSLWGEAGDRTLEVTNVHPGDRLGREVIGFVSLSLEQGWGGRPYACPLTTWRDVWRDCQPPWEGQI